MDLRNRIHKDIRAALDECGYPWEAKLGSSHIKLILAGKMVGIFPLNGGPKLSAMGASRAVMNTVAQIRRAVNELQSRDSDVVSNDRL